jgi:hypothetical protein
MSGPSNNNPTPALSPGQPVQAPCQTCQKTPCDVDTLWFQVTGNTEKPPKVLNLETVKNRRSERVTGVDDQEVVQLLQNYDLIIDTIADPVSRLVPEPKTADIEAKATYHGLSCKPSMHAEIDLVHENGWQKVEQKDPIKDINAAQIQLPLEKFYAHDSFIDSTTGSYNEADSLKDVFGLLTSFIEAFKERHVEVRTKSCGVREEGDPKRPNGALLGLVRVHRNSTWTIELKVPPWGNRTWTRGGSINALGTRTSTSSSSNSTAFGTDSYSGSSSSSSNGASSSSESIYAGGRTHSESESVSANGTHTLTEQNESTGTKLTQGPDGVLEEETIGGAGRESGFDLVITHNGVKVEFGGMVRKLIELFQQFVEIIEDIKSLFNAIPQVGWKFTFDISFFEGTLKFGWKPRYLDSVLASGRYRPVENLVTLTVGMTVISIKVGASFGLDARAAGTGLTITASGELSLKVELNFSIQLTHEKPQDKVELVVDATLKFDIVGNASVAGYTLADAKVSADGGLKFTGEFLMDWTAKERFKLTGKLELKRALLTGHIEIPWWWDEEIDPPIVLIEGRDLWHFN